MAEKMSLDRAELELLREHVMRYLTAHMKDYGWWTNQFNYQPWMNDAIMEYQTNQKLYEKLSQMMEEADA